MLDALSAAIQNGVKSERSDFPPFYAAVDTGLKIRSGIDDNEYPLGVKVSDEQMKGLNIRHDGFHGEWNYTLVTR